MMHSAWSSIVEVPYCFSRSYVKFQGHTALKIVEFDPNWAFPDSNSSLNSPMAMKCCTKLETAKERCPVVFQGHPSNSKVTRDKTSPILTQIGGFRTIGRSQLSNPSDLPCLYIDFNPCALFICQAVNWKEHNINTKKDFYWTFCFLSRGFSKAIARCNKFISSQHLITKFEDSKIFPDRRLTERYGINHPVDFYLGIVSHS